MPTSFLTPIPASPELAQIASQALIHGFNAGNQKASEEAARVFAVQQNQYTQREENYRAIIKGQNDAAKALLEQKSKNVEHAAKSLQDRIDRNYSYIQANTGKGDPAALERIAFDIRNDEKTLSDIHTGFNANPIGYQVPSLASNMSALPGDYGKTSANYEAEQSAKTSKAQADNTVAQANAASATQISAQTGGKYSTVAGLNFESLDQNRQFNQDYRLSKKTNAGANKAVDSFGNPLNATVLRSIQNSTYTQPKLWSDYRSEYEQYHSMPEGEEKAKLGLKLKSRANSLKTSYDQIGQYVSTNASAAEQQFIAQSGIGLNSATMADDGSKLLKIYQDAKQPKEVRAIAANLHKGLGFGVIPGAPAYSGESAFGRVAMDDMNDEGLLSQ